MTGVPEPMTPVYCDLRGYDYMPLQGTKLFGSRFWSLARRNPRAGLAGLKLWWEAWNQCPAGSLPSDDFDLADLAGFGEDKKAWMAAKAIAMHGFVLCSDGRFYHATLAELAIQAYDRRLASNRRREEDRERLREWREKRKAKPAPTPRRNATGNAINGADETARETGIETDEKRVSTTVDVKRSEVKKERAISDSKPARANRGTPEMPAVSDPPERWAALAETYAVGDDGAKHPIVAGYYLDGMARDLCEAAGFDNPNYRGDWGVLVAWLKDGIESDPILATVKAVADRARASGRPPASLRYFDKAVRELCHA